MFVMDKRKSNNGEKNTQNTPFLLKFAKDCLSPGRTASQKDYFYDESSDLVRWLGDEKNTPAIELEDKAGPLHSFSTYPPCAG